MTEQKKLLISNTNKLLEIKNNGWKIGFLDSLFLLKSLGLSNKVYNLHYSLSHILALQKFCNSDAFKTKSYIFESLNLFLTNKKEILKSNFEEIISEHKSDRYFIIDNETFDTDPCFGLFAGLPISQLKRYELHIHKDSPTHHAFLTLSLICFIQQNHIFKDPTSIKGIKSAYLGSRSLASLANWHLAYKQLIKKYFERHRSKGESTHIVNFMSDYEKNPDPYHSVLKTDNQKTFLRKLLEIYKELSTYISFKTNESCGPTDDKILEDSSNQNEILIDPPLPDNSTKNEELAESENKFIQHLGIFRSAKQAQIIRGSNSTLAPSEVSNLESFINTFNSKVRITQIKQLVWSLQLYYAIPLGIKKHQIRYYQTSIPSIIVGTPNLDIDYAETKNKCIISIDLGVIFLPTPLEEHQPNTLSHTPLPLHKRVKELIEKITDKTSGFKLSDIISADDFIECNKFSDIPEFKQYRYTSGKINRVLTTSVFYKTQDEVKTAYLQGGSFEFKHMGLHYTKLSIRGLNEIFNSVTQKIFSFPTWVNDNELSNFLDINLGSKHAIKTNYISDFLNKKFSELIALKKAINTADDFVNFHNYLTLYTLAQLCLVSTHRPHRDPFYSIKNFIDTHLVQITEKELHQGYEGRIATLDGADVVISQLKEYKKHLYSFAYLCKINFNNEFEQELIKIINGTQNPKNGLPAFFIIENGKVQHITSTTFYNYYNKENLHEFKSNFVRHSFSTFMSEQNVPRYLIAAQMGHNSKGNEIFGSNSNTCPHEFSKELAPFIKSYIQAITPQLISALNKRSIRNIKTSKIDFKNSRLGPFYREFNRRVHIDKNEIEQFDTLFFDGHIAEKKLYISKHTQIAHFKKIQNSPNLNNKLLIAYYQFKQSNFGWRIQKSHTLEKSLFSANYPSYYLNGKSYIETVGLKCEQYIKDHNSFDIKEKKVLLALTFLTSGAVLTKGHIEHFLQNALPQPVDASITLSVDFYNEFGSIRTVLLNSVSSVLFLDMAKTAVEIDKNSLQQILTRWQLPNLSSLIKGIQAFHRLSIPAYLIEFSLNEKFHGTIGAEGYKKLFTKNWIDTCHTPSKLSSFSNRYISDQHPIASKSVFLNDLNIELNICKKGINKTELKFKLLAFKQSFEVKNALSLLEELVYLWVISLIEEDNLKPGTVKDYFSRIYEEVNDALSNINLLELDTSDFIKTIYPPVLKILRDKSEGFSELKRFHNFIADFLNVNKLHFTPSKIHSLATIQRTIYPHEMEAIEQAISNDEINDDSHTRSSLQTLVTLYNAFGIRASEPFEIKQDDLLLEDKILFILGNSHKSKKSADGNRALHLDLLNQTSFNEIVSKAQHNNSDSQNKPFLLFRNLDEFDRNVVNQQIRSYLLTLMKSLLNSETVNIKSFRKSFASFGLNNIVISGFDNIPKILGSAIPEKIAMQNFDSQLGHNAKHKRLWLVSDWIGHSSPQTTLIDYASTLELNLFIATEALLEQNNSGQTYTNRLKLIASLSNKKITQSTLKNLNRHKGMKYTQFFSKDISNNVTNETDSFGKPVYTKLLEKKASLEIIRAIVEGFVSGTEPNNIDSHLLLHPGTCTFLLSLIYREIPGFSEDVTPKGLIALKPFLVYLFDLRQKNDTTYTLKKIEKSEITWLNSTLTAIQQMELKEPYNNVKAIWRRNTANFNEGLIFQNTNELIQFLKLIEKLFKNNSKVNHHYYINHIGTKLVDDFKPLSINTTFSYETKDLRIIKHGALPKSHYEVVLSTRKQLNNRPKKVHSLLHLIFILEKVLTSS